MLCIQGLLLLLSTRSEQKPLAGCWCIALCIYHALRAAAAPPPRLREGQLATGLSRGRHVSGCGGHPAAHLPAQQD
jgi:hypothetical protein